MSAAIQPLLFVPRYWPALGGAELHSRRLAVELARHVPVEVMRCCSTEDVPADYAFAYAQEHSLRDGAVGIQTIAPSRPVRPVLRFLSRWAPNSRLVRGLYGRTARFAAAGRFRAHAARSGASVVHGIYNGFTPGAEALHATGRPFVWTPLAHTTRPEGTAWSSAGFKRLYRKADALIAMTEYERDWLIRQGAPSSRVHVCPMAPLFDDSLPDPAGFLERYELSGKPVILFLGRMAEYKGYRALLDAADQVWSQRPDARFVFAGPLTGKARAAFEARQDPRILVTGALSDADKKSALAAASLVCVPSTEESLGVVYLEAWSFEKPVIAADIPAMRSVVDHKRDGLLCAQAGQPIAEAISYLLERPARARQMGLEGASKVSERYNWAAIAARHLEIYSQVI